MLWYTSSRATTTRQSVREADRPTESLCAAAARPPQYIQHQTPMHFGTLKPAAQSTTVQPMRACACRQSTALSHTISIHMNYIIIEVILTSGRM